MAKLYLAPMEGVLDYTLREILTSLVGIDQCVTEFIRVSDRLLPRSVFYRLAPELYQGGVTRSGVPVYLQLLGSDPALLAENAARAAELGAPGIDLNFGCPAKTVNKSHGGAVLLKEPDLLHDIVYAVRQAVPAHIPVTAKMRLGFLDKSLAIENAQAIESAGAGCLTVHARTKLEGYKPPAHWEWIAKIREAVDLQVIANGEVWNRDDYLRCQTVSGCQDVMLGRGMLSNPFLAESLVTGDESITQAQRWQRLLPMLEKYLTQVTEDLSERHVHGRLKQWLNMLRWHFPQAELLFAEIRSERDPAVILAKLKQQQVIRQALNE